MAIVGALPSVLVNGTPNDAVPLMSDLNFIAAQVNANGAQLAGGNTFTGSQVVPASGGRTHAAQTAQVQDGAYSWCGTAGGGANALTLTAAPPISGYTAGQAFVFKALATNTAATQVNINGAGNADIKNRGAALAGSEIFANLWYRITHDGAAFELEELSATSIIAQNAQSGAYGLVFADLGKHILHPVADNNPRTYTIPSNAATPFTIGAAITFVNEINALTIAITADTLTFAGSGATGSRVLAANGIATALKITATKWMISGTNLS